MDVDVGLEEHSKRSKGKSGAEVQSDMVRSSGKRARGVLKVLAVEQTSS